MLLDHDVVVDYQDATNIIFAELRIQRELTTSDDPEIARRSRLKVDEKTGELVKLHFGLVAKYVRRFTRTTTPAVEEEFMQAGLLGLLKAINSYDPALGRFSSWAYKPIQREVLGAFHHEEYQTLRPADFERRALIVREIQTRYPAGEKPDPAVIADGLGLSLDQVERVVNAVSLSSLSTPVGTEQRSTLEELIPDGAVSVEDRVATTQMVRSVQVNGLSQLTVRERHVVVRRFGLDSQPEQKLTEIGEDMGLSREAIRQIEAKALAKLAHPALLSKIVRADNV